ncbi:hypothetical protein TNIN_162061 [Trichonephila inaurata madagascariensis]|uniref:Uncharacterized protein n=1 Tax=Trichonephila inaurata madagascariensis TaxID=2747483 RepID=A0A8X6YFY8_9ARAC|nr:hypothetical protein TNIN_162061 [Trichonephila inaurata madagascariensis]
MSRKNFSVQETQAIFKELGFDDDSITSYNSDTDDAIYIENVAQGENISSDDEEIDEIQCSSTSQTKVKWGKLYKNIDLLQNSRKQIPVKTEGGLYKEMLFL